MTRDEKDQLIEELKGKLGNSNIIYLADVSCLTVAESNKLRRQCHQRNVSLQVVKNTLLQKAIEQVEEKDLSELTDLLKGNTSLMISEVANAPAKLIKNFRKKSDRPLLKGAYIDSAIYKGDDLLDTLAQLKSKEELIGDVIMLLQSPLKNVLSGLNSGASTLAGIVKTLSERTESEKPAAETQEEKAAIKPSGGEEAAEKKENKGEGITPGDEEAVGNDNKDNE